jgi:uncharacterized protein YfaS (alpha-2-macroglobulin family)
MSRCSCVSLLGLLVLSGVVCLMAAETPLPQQRATAEQLMQDGNFRDALAIYSRLVLAADNAGPTLAGDFQQAVECLNRLQRHAEIDELREKVIAAHPRDWRLLQAAAESLIAGPHHGFIVASEFKRGTQRGGGEFASSVERDRTRALQLYQQAAALIPDADETGHPVANFYRSFAVALLFARDGGAAWRFQDLTDLNTLPDYEVGYQWGRGDRGQGAAVDADGNPVYHTVPEAFAAATSDGQRWRWCLAQMSAHVAPLSAETDWTFAVFQHQQFGVQTLRQWGILLPMPRLDDPPPRGNEPIDSGPYALHTLGENETIARLASGVKRFTLPDEFNPIVIFQRLAAGDSPYAEQAHYQLAQIFEDRQQYPKAADWWRRNIEKFGDPRADKKTRLGQIVGNWGTFENVSTQAAGTGATVEFRFRNARRVTLTAQAIRIEQLLADVKAYLKSNPRQLDWNQLQIDNIGYRLVEQNERKYLGEQVAQWSLDLQPRPEHFDRRITVATPLQTAGVYLVTAKLDNGNTSRIILWVDDTAIVKKQLDNQVLYFVADAASGRPIEQANVEFFGWRQVPVANARNEFRVQTQNFAETTDAEGIIVLDPRRLPQDYQWLVIARTDSGRLAHLGFSGVWYNRRHDAQYHENKAFVVTDRPVYRPEQKVQFKFWMRETKYDLDDRERFARLPFTVRIYDPQGTEVFRQVYTTDEYGGLAGEYRLPRDAKLGQYSLAIDQAHNVGGGGSFRVEEYKKPEFEVLVEAPARPVQLGDKVAATIRAKYYFGAPLTNATAKIKVERTPHDARWFPARPWDWLYGEGYWWFTSDYGWYPGFARWGCFAPRPVWFPWQPDPPELVLDQEVAVGADGTVAIEIDTALAKALHGDQDHRYAITAEIVDASRRSIVGTGEVLVAREPFKVFAWTDRGHYRVGDVIHAHFQARTLDGRGVAGQGTLKLLRITYNDAGEPVENVAQQWDLPTNADGYAQQELKAGEPGQYRLSLSVTDEQQHTIEGGHLFVVRGEGFDGSEFQFNDLELVVDKAEYAPGENVELLVNTNRVGSTVLLFLRPANGVYAGRPQLLKLAGKSTTISIGVVPKDMPNFFIEAVTIAGGKVHTVLREVVVPPEKRVLNVEVLPGQERYLPGAKADVRVKVTDAQGEPYVGSLVLAVYDRAVEYISGGSNVPEIRAFFWKWRRHHHPQTEHSLARWFYNLAKSGEEVMTHLGAFGDLVADLEHLGARDKTGAGEERRRGATGRMMLRKNAAAEFFGDRPAAAVPLAAEQAADALGAAAPPAPGAPGGAPVQPLIRTQFADTAYWNATLTTDEDGFAHVSFDMPENLSDWKVRVWGMGHGTRVGEATASVVTAKNIIIRLQSPRFFVEKDEVVLSAIVHNYLKTEKLCRVELALDGGTLELMESSGQSPVARAESRPTVTQLSTLNTQLTLPAGGEVRVDWRCKVIREGVAKITMQALTDEESDAMQQSFPVYVHGFLKTESFTGVIRGADSSGVIEFTVPADRRPEQTRLEVRYSPTLAGAMVDALPYLVDYPYGCTEQTLNRFLPTVITHNILKRMGVNLQDVRDKRTNLNPQEIGDDRQRAEDWRRLTRQAHGKDWNPVFDEHEVHRMVQQGVQDLTNMQLSDGGWGWFSGFGERSYPHTTAVVVHGLQLAQANGVPLVPGVLEKGIAWLKRYQEKQVELLKLYETTAGKTGKARADNIDALVYMVLVDSDVANDAMRDRLYRDRLELALYSQALLGLALHKQQDVEKRDMIVRNLDQFLTVDAENQTAFLDLPNRSTWWYWYGSTIEANAFYLKLLTAVNPQDPKAAGLVKYLLNNRRHATYWNSTRDTAYCIEALADYLVASGEAAPHLLVEVWLDGQLHKAVEITPEVLFSFDNAFVIEGEALAAGKHTLELKKQPLASSVQGPESKTDGSQLSTLNSPLYYNAYLTNFSTEEHITAAGLEIKVGRKFFKLVQRQDATDVVRGERGQVIDQQALKYDRVEIANLAEVHSGDLIEIELEIDAKNDYEYVIFEDLKAAGCEPVDLQSGYTRGGLGAYVEFRDERTAFFLRSLTRGKHSVSYRVRAEIPGRFSALPARASAMYAPELNANSEELKLQIRD